MSDNQYIQILTESLKKKTEVLNGIMEQNQKQTDLIAAESFDADAFDGTMREKDRLIEELNLLDEGFTTVYEKVKEDLLTHKDIYRVQIKEMQALISKITEQSVSIQTAEERNRKAIAGKFSVERKKIHQTRATAKAASGYYANMNKLNYVDAQFVDRKK